MKLRSIFINYRRSDTAGEAGRLFDDLTAHFNDQSVFMDVSTIEIGRDFRKAIDDSVSNCSVLLAMIGLEWLEAKDAIGHRRLEDPSDFVRIELASALRRGIPVVPVLVRGANTPQVGQLPDDLKELAFRNAVELTHARWKSDVQLLIRALRQFMDEPGGDDRAESRSQAQGISANDLAGMPIGERNNARVIVFALEPERREHITKLLASYIGPIAELIVNRAAKRCNSQESLCGMLAKEIEREADRANFLKACRR